MFIMNRERMENKGEGGSRVKAFNKKLRKFRFDGRGKKNCRYVLLIKSYSRNEDGCFYD